MGINKQYLLPALKDRNTGKIIKGKRGQDHLNIIGLPSYALDKVGESLIQKYDPGYFDQSTKKFHSRDERGYDNLDSTDLMTDVQRNHWQEKMLAGLKEDAAVNSAGGGNIASIGVGPKGEPGANSSTLIRRSKFAGKDVFDVDNDFFHKCVAGKKKYAKYSDYVGTDETGEAIRQFGRDRKTASQPIIIKHDKTGAMVFLKYGSK